MTKKKFNYLGSWSTVEVTEFDNLGYKIIRNLYNPILLKLPMPGVLGKYSYRSSNLNNFKFILLHEFNIYE